MDRQLKSFLLTHYGPAFTSALEVTMAFEGGWSNHPSDRGGKTKYGVTESALGAYNVRTFSGLRVETLTRTQAADVYHVMYWREMRIANLPGPVQGFMFDWSVHAGFFAIRSMQRHFKLKPDGVVGPRTRAAVASAIVTWGSAYVVRALAIRRMKHLCRLVRRYREQGEFLAGWWTRVSHWLK